MVTKKGMQKCVPLIFFERRFYMNDEAHWIVEIWNNLAYYTCSTCLKMVKYEPGYCYCPYCGKKMIGRIEVIQHEG